MYSSEADFQKLLSSQLSMTHETWKRLQSHGVNEQTPLKLDFLYYAPTRQSAESCKNHLLQYEYKVSIWQENNESWVVEGQTQSTEVNKEILLQWVDYMVSAGWQYGCHFDGWGTEVP